MFVWQHDDVIISAIDKTSGAKDVPVGQLWLTRAGLCGPTSRDVVTVGDVGKRNSGKSVLALRVCVTLHAHSHQTSAALSQIRSTVY